MPGSATVGILRVLLTADKSEFDAAMKAASGSAKAWSKDLGSIGQQASNVGRALTTALTLPLVGMAVGASKLAIDFESSFAGVRKTVQATEPEFAKMAQAFRDLSKQIPINVNELNRLGEAAGALGVPKAEIVDFARVMALLGTTTNVTSEQAAESIAKIQNIFGASGKATENFASTLVDLGNKGASTEQEILALATRIASAGNTVGMTQAEVLGFASAIANVGMEAEAGGSAMSRVILEISKAVSAGGPLLDGFLKITGMTAERFTKLFKEDAASAVQMFIEGLGEIKRSGGDLNQVLGELGFTELRQSDLLRRLAGNWDMLNESVFTSKEAWTANNALMTEANERFKTTESQMTLLWSRIKDVGIVLGNALKPSIDASISMLNVLLPLVDGLAKGFAALPVPLQGTVLLIGGLVAAIGPLLFAFGQMALGAQSIVALFGPAGLATKVLTLTGGFSGLTTAASSLAVALGPAVLVAAVLGAMVAFEKLEVATRDSLQAVKDGEATWGDIPSLLGNAISRGINPFGAAVRDMTEIWKRFPAEFAAGKDLVVRISQQLYEGVSTWLVTKFGAIVESLRAKVALVKGYFKDLYDKVVGQSYVPDLVEGVIREFNRLQGGMVVPALVMTQQTGSAFGALRDRVLGDFSQMKDGVLRSLGDMLSGVTGWKEGFLDIFRGLKQGISQIITDILNDVTGRLVKGLIGSLTGTGGFAQSFSGGGGINYGSLLGLGGSGATAGSSSLVGISGTVGGLPGTAAGVGGTAGGAGAGAGTAAAIGVGASLAAAGAGVGLGMLGKEIFGGAGWKAGTFGAASGAVSGAIIGSVVPVLGTAIGALIGGFAGLISGWVGKTQAMKVNDARDLVMAQGAQQFGGKGGVSGFGEGSDFSIMAAKLNEATGSNALFEKFLKANTMKEFEAATLAVGKALQDYKTKTDAAASSTADNAAAIEATKKQYADQAATIENSIVAVTRTMTDMANSGTLTDAARDALELQRVVYEQELARILDQGQAAIAELGLVGDEAAENIKAPLLEALRDVQGEFRDTGQTLREIFDRKYTVDVDYTGGWGSGGGGGMYIPNPPSVPQFAAGSGGFRDFGAGTLAMLHGREEVRTAAQAGAASPITFAPIINLYGIDGPSIQKLAESKDFQYALADAWAKGLGRTNARLSLGVT